MTLVKQLKQLKRLKQLNWGGRSKLTPPDKRKIYRSLYMRAKIRYQVVIRKRRDLRQISTIFTAKNFSVKIIKDQIFVYKAITKEKKTKDTFLQQVRMESPLAPYTIVKLNQLKQLSCGGGGLIFKQLTVGALKQLLNTSCRHFEKIKPKFS